MSAQMQSAAAGVRAPLAGRSLRTRRASACVTRAIGNPPAPKLSPNNEAVKLANSVGLSGLEVRSGSRRPQLRGACARAPRPRGLGPTRVGRLAAPRGGRTPRRTARRAGAAIWARAARAARAL
jgi:hypothetical protein